MDRLSVSFFMLIALGLPVHAQMKFSLGSAHSEYASGKPIELSWKLLNGSEKSWVVYSETDGNYDAVSLHIEGPGGVKNLPLSSPRLASRVTGCLLKPRQTLENKFDLTYWANLAGYRMPPGKYTIVATYNHPAKRWQKVLDAWPTEDCSAGGGEVTLTPPKPVWDGELTSPKLEITLR